MPLFDLACSRCSFEDLDRYYPTFAASEVDEYCRQCGALMHKRPPLISFTQFQPFYTHNITPDGSGVYVRDRAQLRELCRKYNVRQLDSNPIKEHFGSNPKSVPGPGETQKPHNKRPKPKGGPVTFEDAKKAQEFAERTNFGMQGTR